MNVSRTPVHEALLLLKTEQLVNIIPQSGSKVSLISLENVREGLFIRSCVEPSVYQQIAGNLSEAHLQEMSECLKKSKELLDADGDDYEFMRLDDEYHKLAYIAAHKPNVWNAAKKVCSHYDMIRFHDSAVVKENKKKIFDEHLQLFEYMLSGGKAEFDINAFYEQHLTGGHYISKIPIYGSNMDQRYSHGYLRRGKEL